MKCLIHVIKRIFQAMFFVSILGGAMAAALIAAIWTQKALGLPEIAGLGIGLLYMMSAFGAVIGITECRRGLS